jgi:Zn-finger nucleic acid-binding protein
MNCPSCNTVLTLTERSGVEIDYCPQCRGVWLDRGELDKILERSAAYEEPRRQKPFTNKHEWREYDDDYRKRYDDDHDKYPHKRKSFLGELFDF